MTIREMKPEDYAEAMALWNGARGVGRSQDDSEENIRRFLARNPGTSFVAEERGKIVGAVMAGHDGYRGYFHHTAVAEPWRGRGIGQRLVRASLDAMKAQGVNKAALVAFKTNEAGNSFWEKMGFSVREDLLYRNLRINNFEEGNPR